MTIHICSTLRLDRKGNPKDATKAKLNKPTFCGIELVLWWLNGRKNAMHAQLQTTHQTKVGASFNPPTRHKDKAGFR